MQEYLSKDHLVMDLLLPDFTGKHLWILHVVRDLLLSDFPGKHLWIFDFIIAHPVDYTRSCDLGLAASYLTRVNVACFSIPEIYKIETDIEIMNNFWKSFLQIGISVTI